MNIIKLLKSLTGKKIDENVSSPSPKESISLSLFDEEKIAQIINQSEGSITFVVDENLPPPEENLIKENGEKIAHWILSQKNVPNESHQIVAYSFADETMTPCDEGVFFNCAVQAYATHRPLMISPDMIWLLICQGFARYVNAHSDQLRNLLVSHEGKKTLIVNTEEDLFNGNPDWEKIFFDFAAEINKNIKGDLADIIKADFTTTKAVERIASEITLMETFKSYFEYVIDYCICGIPTITINGTAEDWKHILEKAIQLKEYGMSEWISDLETILHEFIKAAEGIPNQTFWKRIVKKQLVDRITGGNACIPEEPTVIDGWLLKFFPDENGFTFDKVIHSQAMPSEMVCVDFKYRLTTPEGIIFQEFPMQFLAGFVGFKEDSKTFELTPKIGWIVRRADADDDAILKELKCKNERGYIELKVKEVPKQLLQLKYISHLRLNFDGPVVLPEWLNEIKIDDFSISGNLSVWEKRDIQQQFPNVRIC